MMTDPENPNHESRQIDTVYQILLFEIENANYRLTGFQKDTMDFILLMLALIGFFAFIPLDVFLYAWFGSAVLVWIICSGIGVLLSLSIYWAYIRSEKSFSPLHSGSMYHSCDGALLRDDVVNPSGKNTRENVRDGMMIESIASFFSAFHFLGMVFLLTAIAAYGYLVTSDPGNTVSSLVRSDPVIAGGLIVSFLIYAVSRQKREQFRQDKCLGRYLACQLVFSGILLIAGIIIGTYGLLSKVPPFIPVSGASQVSVVLLQHSVSGSSFQILLLVYLYTAVIFIVLFDHFLSSAQLETTNRKLIGLLSLKNRIDRHRLGLSPCPDIRQIRKEVLSLKTVPPRYIPFAEIIRVPVPSVPEEYVDTLLDMPDGLQPNGGTRKE